MLFEKLVKMLRELTKKQWTLRVVLRYKTDRFNKTFVKILKIIGELILDRHRRPRHRLLHQSPRRRPHQLTKPVRNSNPKNEKQNFDLRTLENSKW